MSESVREVRELTHLYWSTHTVLEKSDDESRNTILSPGLDGVDVLDAAVGAVSSLANQGLIDELTEAALIQQAFQRHPELMVLSKHYGNDLRKFLEFLPNIDSRVVTTKGGSGDPDAIVVGTGLAGLAATLNILDRGGRVTLIEKEHRMGGNSNKASSGINACCPQNATYGDSLDTFRQDTTRSAGLSAKSELIDVLVENSESAVQWLKERVGVDLSVLSQLGGHGHKRTHRPRSGMVGAEIIYNIQKAVKKYEQSGIVQIMLDTRVTSLKKDENGTVVGVEVTTKTLDGEMKNMTLTSPNVILATGGFASDRRHGSYLEKYRPELMKMPATAGEFSTGDGIALGTSVGAGLVDMEKVQVHPTGWVDPKHPTNPGKILAGELMRGVGGILINQSGKRYVTTGINHIILSASPSSNASFTAFSWIAFSRFCNELGTRAYVVEKMFSHDRYYNETKTWNVNSEIPTFSLVLSASAANDAKKHVDHYLNKGLIVKLEGLNALSEWMKVPVSTLKTTLREYQRDAKSGKDQWGKTSFSGVPQDDLSKEIFYAGTVTPVLHYCMGGLTIDKNGSVLDEDNNIIPGLHAAGEVSGGVHGDNRLGGNSLLECTVFGSIVGQKIPIRQRNSTSQLIHSGKGSVKGAIELPKLTMEDVRQHNSDDDCWIAIHGKVYDLTDFAEEHPAGPESILELAGQDGTEAFDAVHSEGVLEEFEPIGIL
jgi:succinate dehydrogenase/fumarate reductase flavoprotein subunit/predicted heme/steroid binding protein